MCSLEPATSDKRHLARAAFVQAENYVTLTTYALDAYNVTAKEISITIFSYVVPIK